MFITNRMPNQTGRPLRRQSEFRRHVAHHRREHRHGDEDDRDPLHERAEDHRISIITNTVPSGPRPVILEQRAHEVGAADQVVKPDEGDRADDQPDDRADDDMVLVSASRDQLPAELKLRTAATMIAPNTPTAAASVTLAIPP
jgi:hypothetical protein